jgi:hypothetical protein
VQWTNPYPTTTGPAASAAAQAGLAAHGTRDDLTDSITAPDPASAAAFEQAYAAQDVPTEPTPAQVRRISRDVTDYLTATWPRRPRSPPATRPGWSPPYST